MSFKGDLLASNSFFTYGLNASNVMREKEHMETLVEKAEKEPYKETPEEEKKNIKDQIVDHLIAERRETLAHVRDRG